MGAIRFNRADLEAANAGWGCNCGPAALAAICGLTLEEVRPHFPGFKGWTNVPRMLAAIDGIGRDRRSWTPTRDGHGIDWPSYGLALIAFDGPWTEPNPARERWLKIERAKRTHWVGVSRLQLAGGGEDPCTVCVWDINAVGRHFDGWLLAAVWEGVVVPALTADIKRATGGWCITHAIEIKRP